jgi:hypothetical protein
MAAGFRDTSRAIDARELLALSRSLKGVKEGRKLRRQVSKANRDAVKVVAEQAQDNASTEGRQAARVSQSASSFKRTASADRASVAIVGATGGAGSDLDKGDPRRFAFGSEFGAYQNKIREVGVRRTRIGASGSGKRRRYLYAQDVRNARQVRGWNQFQPWRGSGNAGVGQGIQPGYWLYPAVRDTQGEVAEKYGAEAARVVAAAIASGLI